MRAAGCCLALAFANLLIAQDKSGTVATPPSRHDEISVTASRSNVPLGDTAKTTSTIGTEELHDYPALTLDDSLRQHAGFELFRRSGSRIANPTSQGISLRGLGSTAASRTLVLEDGAPLNDPFGGWIHWDDTPSRMVDSVSIVSGGGSDLYGSSALGGVIDLVPAHVSPRLFELSTDGGSQSTSRVEGRADYRFKPLAAQVGVESLRTAGYWLVAPELAGAIDTPANVHSQSARVEVGRRDFARARVFATGNFLNEARQNGTLVQANGTRLWRYLAGYETGGNGQISARLRGFGSDEAYRQSFSAVAPGRNSETLSRLQHVRSQEFGATTDVALHLRKGALVAGADLRDIRARDDEAPFAKGVQGATQATSARQRFMGGFGEALGQAGRWSGAASLRIDRSANLDVRQSATVAPTLDRAELLASPRVGLEGVLGHGLALHASAFRAFRAPTMNELYRTGQVGQETTLANAALRSERATGWEVGVNFLPPASKARAQATYFWTEINRPVSAVLISQTATTITNQRQNLGRIVSRGIEISGEFGRGKPVWISGGYQFADARVTRFAAQPGLVGNRIPQVPQHAATVQIHAQGTRWGSATLAMRTSSQSFDDSANLFSLRRFVTLDVSASHTFRERVEAYVLVQNLLNQRADVARTPVLTLGSPIFAVAGLRLRLR